jgi:enoyl-CoA hydratase/carnithine racemase
VSDRVICTIADGVADVRLNRPEKRNALDAGLFLGLVETAARVAADRSLRAVVLSGNGSSFCAGLDLTSFDGPDAHKTFTAMTPSGFTNVAQQCAWAWQEVPVPVIAAVHGHALGGGLQIALGADIRIVHPDTKLSVMEIVWGLVPDMTATQLLPALVGLDRAKELTFTGRIVSGTEAVALGLCTMTSADPVTEALAMATAMASRNPHALRGAKRNLNLAGSVSMADGFAAERALMDELLGSVNQNEAVAAAREGRPPVFVDP